MIDHYGRSIDYLRISITDRCNLRCVYCMPENGVDSFSHSDILSYEEIVRVVEQAAKLGIRHLRITGGEPTVRRGWIELIRSLHAIPGIETIAMTTNGLLLAPVLHEAIDAGLTGINVSIDTLDPERYHMMTRTGDVNVVRQLLFDGVDAGLRVKVNAVPVRGMNDTDLADLALLAKDRPIDVRFIELMPVGCGATLAPISSDEILDLMRDSFGELETDSSKHGFGPAAYVKPKGFVGSLGVISPLSHEFCENCNRIRLTAEGRIKLCLNHTAGMDVRSLLRVGCTDDDLLEQMKCVIASKPKRHGFHEAIDDRENKTMNAIGG